MEYKKDIKYQTQKENKYQTTCISCDGKLVLGEDIEKNEIIECPECGLELEIKNTDPIILEEAPKVKEDWGE